MKKLPTFLLLSLTAGCWLTQNNNPRPPCEGQFIEIAQDTSYLSTPLVIPTQLIEDKINGALQQDWLSDDSPMWEKRKRSNNRLKMKVSRLGNIQVAWKDNVVQYKIPLVVLVERHIISEKTLRLPKSMALKTEFSLQLVFRTTLDIDENWQLQPKTRFQNFSWLSNAKTLGDLIHIERMVERKMRRQMPMILHNMDSSIRANVHLDRVMGRVWQNIQKPIAIHRKDVHVWLKVQPIHFEMGTIKSEKDNLLVQIRLSATTETIVGDTPVYNIIPILPALIKRRSLPDNAFIYMRSEIPLADINAIFKQKIVGKVFDISSYHIKLNTVEVYSCGSDLVICLGVKGDLNGDIYFKGTPQYEPDSQRMVIKNFDFEVKTKEFLLGSSDWLLHDTFKEQVKNTLSIELADEILKIPSAIMAGIERGRVGQKMDISIEHWDFKPQQIWVRPTDIAVLIIVNAQAKIELEQL